MKKHWLCTLVALLSCVGLVHGEEGEDPQPAAEVTLEVTACPVVQAVLRRAHGSKKLAELRVAEAGLTNRRKTSIRKVGVRFRIAPFTSWSDWRRIPELKPGIRLRVSWFPRFTEAFDRLEGSTTALLEVEWKAVGADGSSLSGTHESPVEMLGADQAVLGDPAATAFEARFRHAPAIAAALMSESDPLLKELGQQAADRVRGADRMEPPKLLTAFLRELILLLLDKGVVVDVPSGFLDSETRVAVRRPRDVLMDKRGSALDIAILLLSVARTAEMDADLVFVPGAAVLTVDLPGETDLALDPTALTIRDRRKALGAVAARGAAHMERAAETGVRLKADVAGFRRRGLGEIQWKPPAAAKPAPKEPSGWSIAHDGGGTFRINLPPTWKVVMEASSVSGFAPQETGFVYVESGPAPPGLQLDALVDKALPALKGSLDNWRLTERGKGTIAGHPAVLLDAMATEKGVPISVGYAIQLAEGSLYIISAAHPAKGADERLPTMTRIVTSFTPLPAKGRGKPWRVVQAVGRTLQIEVPSAWTTTLDPTSIVAREGSGLAQAVVRIKPRSVGSLDALAARVEAGMRRRGRDLKLAPQGDREFAGRPARMISMQDRRGGRDWGHMVMVVLGSQREFTVVVSVRGDQLEALRITMERIMSSLRLASP